MTANDLLTDSLKRIGATGLCGGGCECGCELPDIGLCESDPLGCLPAVRGKCPPECLDCDGRGCMVPIVPNDMTAPTAAQIGETAPPKEISGMHTLTFVNEDGQREHLGIVGPLCVAEWHARKLRRQRVTRLVLITSGDGRARRLIGTDDRPSDAPGEDARNENREISMTDKHRRCWIHALIRMVKGLSCQHKRTFDFFPDGGVWWDRDKVAHGLKVSCCVDCGKVWARGYAE